MVVKKGNNHRKPMSVPERAFWREIYKVTWRPYSSATPDEQALEAAHNADLAVEQFRLRVTWRGQ